MQLIETDIVAFGRIDPSTGAMVLTGQGCTLIDNGSDGDVSISLPDGGVASTECSIQQSIANNGGPFNDASVVVEHISDTEKQFRVMDNAGALIALNFNFEVRRIR